MFWSIFLSSVGLIFGILVVGQLIAMLLPSETDLE